MGGSAGAILISQYGAIISNQDYADSLNIAPMLTTNEVKALVIDDAPLATDKFTFRIGPLIKNYSGTNNNLKDRLYLLSQHIVHAASLDIYYCYSTAAISLH